MLPRLGDLVDVSEFAKIFSTNNSDSGAQKELIEKEERYRALSSVMQIHVTQKYCLCLQMLQSSFIKLCKLACPAKNGGLSRCILIILCRSLKILEKHFLFIQ